MFRTGCNAAFHNCVSTIRHGPFSSLALAVASNRLPARVARSRKFSPLLFERLGSLLAALHSLRPDPDAHGFRAWAPRADFLTQPRLENLQHYSHGTLELVGVFQEYGEFAATLQRLCANATVECLVHGDVKFDNLLRVHAGEPTTTLCLTDWEHAAVGDRAWDVGSVFANALSWWVFSTPIAQEVPSQALLTSLRHPLDAIGASARRFCASYTARACLDPNDRRTVIVRAMQLAAVRMVQTAFETMMQRSRLTANVVCLLQLSQNVAADPGAALHDLFGQDPNS